MQDFYDQLLKFASQNLDLREDWGPVFDEITASQEFQRQASRQKQSISQSTTDLIDWAMLRNNAIGEGEVVRFFDQYFGWEPQSSGGGKKSRGGPRWHEGDRIKVKADKCKDEMIKPVVQDVDGEIGTVVKTARNSPELEADSRDTNDIMIDFDNGKTIRIPKGQKSRGSGLYTHTPQKTSGKMIEVVYLSDPSATPSEDQVAEARNYVDNERAGEWRNLSYYSGVPRFLKVSKADQVYFGVQAQQRGDWSNPRHGGFRAMNPTKGKLLYLGVAGSRPSGIESELESLKDRYLG